jgi:hypothetical protein
LFISLSSDAATPYNTRVNILTGTSTRTSLPKLALEFEGTNSSFNNKQTNIDRFN